MHCRLFGACKCYTRDPYGLGGERGRGFILKLNFNQFRFVALSSVSVPSGCQPFLFSSFFCFAIWARLAKKINLSKLQHTHLHREKEIRVHSTATAADALQTERQNNHMSNLSSATKQYTSAEVAQLAAEAETETVALGLWVLWICGQLLLRLLLRECVCVTT